MFWKQKWENKCRYLYLNGLNAFLVEYCSVCSTVFPESRGQVAKAPLNSVQISRSVVSDSVTPWTSARQASLSITNSWSLLKHMSIESVMPSSHLILCQPLLLLPLIWSPLKWTGWISVLSKGLSRVFSNTTVQKHQLFGVQPSLRSNSHIRTRLWKNHSFD